MNKKVNCEIEEFDYLFKNEDFLYKFSLNNLDETEESIESIESTKLNSRIDMSRFISDDYYSFDYFKLKYPKFPDSVIEIITQLSKEKVVIQASLKPISNKNQPIDIVFKQIDTIINFD
jgi:hypothetical protein